jgi:hypothetical protein
MNHLPKFLLTLSVNTDYIIPPSVNRSLMIEPYYARWWQVKD